MADCPTCQYPAPCGRCEDFYGYQWPHAGDLVVGVLDVEDLPWDAEESPNPAAPGDV